MLFVIALSRKMPIRSSWHGSNRSNWGWEFIREGELRMRKKLLFIFLLLMPMLLFSTLVYAKTDDKFSAHLSQEAPGVVTLGQGQAIFRISPCGTAVYYRLIVANLEDLTMAHIHIAALPGGDGPPAVWLYPDAPPPVLIPERTQGTLATGIFMPDDFVGPLAGMDMADLIDAIMDGRAYVNVHTTAYPAGEIRGYLH